MKKLLIVMLICTCVTTTGFAMMTWKFYNCHCHFSRSKNMYYKPTGVTGAVKGSKIGTAKNNPYKNEASAGAIIIVSRTGKIIDIKRY